MKTKLVKLGVVLLLCMGWITTQAQTETFDIATFTAPKGWLRLDSNGVLVFHNYHTQNNLTSFCQIYIFSSRPGNNTPEDNFREEWSSRVTPSAGSSSPSQTQTEKTADGWTVVSGTSNITKQGLTYSCILVTASGFGKVMSIMINMAGDYYLAEMQAFLSKFEMNGNAKSNIAPTNSNTFDFNNYSFTTPDQWQTYKTKDYIMMASAQNVNEGCMVTVFAPQPSSGNLEADAKNFFNQMYPGWQYRYTGEKHDDIMKGKTLQGLDYCMIEAPMHKIRPDGFYYDYEDGAVWVIGVGNKVAVVTGRHNRLLACYCNHKYENWRRFFNSFTVKNQPQSSPVANAEQQIIGDWMSMGGMALTEYIFAANGRYQFIGAYSTSTKTTDYNYEYLTIKTSAFKGDGGYSLKSNQLFFKKDGTTKTDQVQFRFEKVNHGSTGWKDRLYMLKVSEADGKLFEVCYEKQQ